AGRLTVQSGGTVTVNWTFRAAVTGPNQANIMVTGTGSRLQMNNAFVLSSGGDVALNFAAGGQVQVGGTVFLGTTTGGSVTAVIDGTGTAFTTAGQFQMRNGTTSLTVQNGATASAGDAFMGIAAGSNHSVTVTGPNSAFNMQSLQVGGAGGTNGGAGTLNVNSGGAVTIGDALYVYTPGAVNLNAGRLTAAAISDANAAGTVPIA